MRVHLVDLGPRDGLQNEEKIVSPEIRSRLCDRLAAAGVSRVEAASFVNPKRVPQMAGAEEVMAAIDRRPGTSYAGLVLNEKGYERAVQAGVDEVRYAFPVTETFARRNQNTSVADATDLAGKLTERARLDGVRVSITLSSAFGDPFEGRVEPGHVLDIVEKVAQAAPDEIVLADTVGVGVRKGSGSWSGARSRSGLPSAVTSTTPATPVWPTPQQPSSRGRRCSTPLSAARGDVPSHPGRQGTSPPRTSCTFCAAWATRRG